MKRQTLLREVKQLQKVAGLLREEDKFYAPDYLLQILKSEEAVNDVIQQYEDNAAANARDYLLSIDNPEELMDELKDFL